ncbi:MAG: GAF domain-containing protein [Thermoanaerobaculaceae bacterium]|nr:GAF domain-containing protein [Thermoanaerobaculaceae bacterium]TAM45576.1 MAG: GAF domain-containing protein [Acidobacteriota bacterium]
MVRKAPEPKRHTNGRSREVAALLAAARAVLENRAFSDAAKPVLEACKAILGADAGIVALCAPDGGGIEVACLDSGGLEIDVAAGLPEPLGRLFARAVKASRAVIAKSLGKGMEQGSPAGRRATPENALVVPIILGGEVAGLIGLIDKPGGFSAADSRLAEVFAEMAAVAMLNSRTLNGFRKDRNGLAKEVREGAAHLRQAEEQFKTLVENLPDIIARFDADLRHLYVSPSVARVTGRPAQDILGRTNRELGMPPELVEMWDAALRNVFATGRTARLDFAFPAPSGVRYFDCRLVPEPGPRGAVQSVLSVARDVTPRWLAHEAERHARTIADALREATVALTRSLDRETVLATLLDRLRGLVPFDRASVMLLEEASRVSVRAIFDGKRVVPLPVKERPAFDPSDHPIVHGILTSGTAVRIPDVRINPEWSLPTDASSEASWMGVPLFARGDVAGLFSLSKREADYFNEEHMKLAEAMSSQASVAVENAILFEQMQASTVRMRALSHRLVEVQEDERRAIARELHDEAGQALASLRFGLRLLEREIDGGGSVAGRVAELMQRTDAVIDGLHRLAADLRPPSLDPLGLEAALREYVRSAGSKFGFEVRFKARGFASERLPVVVETALYRVVQEAMTNVARHAGATRVDVLAECRGDRVVVMVEDDGAGFEPGRARGGHHFGLLGMRERAEALGGTMVVESAPGRGTTIVVEVPSADPHRDC